MQNRTCQGCTTVITPGPRERNKRKWCSESCRVAAYRIAHPDRNELRKAQKRRHYRENHVPIVHELTCELCSTAFSAKRPEAKYCSPRCKSAAFTATRKDDGRAKAYREQNAERIKEYQKKYAPRWFATDSGQACSQRAEARRRYIETSSESERFTRLEVADRDNWICGLCHGPVDSTLKYPDPLSASLDHITPLSLGGLHIRANAQLAHLRCNLSKGNRVAA